MKKLIYISLMTVLVVTLNTQDVKSKDMFELVQFKTEDGGSIEASFFKASDKKVVIFAHGAIFNKESWYFLAEKFQSQKVSALAIDFRGYGKSKAGSSDKKMYDIVGAINFLRSRGFSDINIVGGSMGGAAVLGALTIIKEPVDRVILMAPAGGSAIQSDQTEKLFIVSKNEGLYSRVINIYQDSSEPKKLKEYNGSAHAQHMFKEDYADEIISLILDFIKKG